MSDHSSERLTVASRQPSLGSYALGLLVGCCLCASLVASLF